MSPESIQAAELIRNVIILICGTSVVVNLALTSYYLVQKAVNEASV